MYYVLCTHSSLIYISLYSYKSVLTRSLDNQIHSIRLSAVLSIFNKLIFPFHSIWIHTLTHAHTRWLADRSKVCCSFWIDPLWYQSAKRSVRLYAKSSSSTSSSLFDCEFKSRNLTRQNENWFYFQHIPSHFVLKKRVCVCWQDSITLKAFTQLWRIENAKIMNIEFVLTFMPRVILLHVAFLCGYRPLLRAVLCNAIELHSMLDVAISVCPLMYYISWKTIMHDARHTL